MKKRSLSSKQTRSLDLSDSELSRVHGGEVISWDCNGIHSEYNTVSKVYTKTINGHTYQVIDGVAVY